MPARIAEWQSRGLKARKPGDLATRSVGCDPGTATVGAGNPTAAPGDFIEIGRQKSGHQEVTE